MTPLQIVFLLVAAATLISAVMVVSVRRIMHAAFWLILTLLGVAVLFVTLETSFFAVVQVFVYIGAIAILFIFAVMLTRRDQREQGRPNNRTSWIAALVAVGVVGGVVGALSGWQSFSALRPEYTIDEMVAIANLGVAFVSPDGYLIPFEVASVLLIGALIGAMYVASEQRK
jgi:NADH-quinone oxidoreductase subunit J